jgi:hypothetical protein
VPKKILEEYEGLGEELPAEKKLNKFYEAIQNPFHPADELSPSVMRLLRFITLDSAIAAALHDSVMEVRSTSRRTPLHWAPYIHLSA